MKTITKLLGALLVVSCFSCKDFLDVTPSNSGDSGSSIQTAADAQVMINGMMRSMTSSNYYGRNFIMYDNAKGGVLTIASQSSGLDALYTFKHSKTDNNYFTYLTLL